MNNNLSITCLILVVASLSIGCHEPGKEESNSNTSASAVSKGQKFVIDTKESVVTWKGSMSVGSNFHTGYVNVSDGDLMVDNGQIVGGRAKVDMNTITDESHRSDNELVRHIKSSDFFDVEKFTVSTIEITRVESITGENKKVTANLTIKNITQPVTFPATMEVKEGVVKAKGKLVIDRTDWGIRYRSGKFYDILADKVISDSVEFDIKIVAKK